MKKIKGYEFILITIILWSYVPILVRLLLPYISAESMLFYRFLIAFLVILPFASITKSVNLTEINSKKLLIYSLLGLLYTGILYSYIIAISYTKIANAQFLQQLAPIYTFIFAHFLLKEHAKSKHYLALILALIGGTLILYFDSGFAFGSSFKGNILALISGLFLASYTTLSRYLGRTYSELEATIWAFIFGTIIMSFSVSNAVSLSLNNWVLLIAMGIFSTALPFLFWVKSLKYIKTQEASILLLLTTITIPILAFLFFNEIPSIGTLIGGTMILIATSIVLKS